MDISKYGKYLAPLRDESVQLFIKQEVPSDYVGNTYIWVKSNVIQVDDQAADDNLTFEIYGERVKRMRKLICNFDSIIDDGMGVSLDISADTPLYKVISAKNNVLSKIVLIEVIGIGNPSQGT
jgi:hypothetical protein